MAELRHFSRSYLSAFASTLDNRYAVIPSHGEWTRQLAQILIHHYARVVRSIETGAMMETTERLDEAVDAERAARLLARAGAQAEMIVNRLETIAGDAMAMMSERKSLPLDEKRQKPRMSVAVVGFFQESWQKFKKKLRTIANVNTQDVAEEAAAAVRASLPEYLTTGTVVHEWVTVGDDRVRGNPTGRYANSPFDHWSADGQRAELPDGVFTVSGETLRFPGDAQRGASLGNLINCRCSLRTIWIKPDGTEEVIEDGILNPSSPARRTRRPGENRNRDTRTQPTSSFTFGYGKGPWRGAVILGNGHRANYTVRNGGVTLRVGGKPVASAPIKRDAFGKWTLGNVTTTEPYRDAGIDRLLRASVQQSNMLPR